jgi:hypothetical protein
MTPISDRYLNKHALSAANAMGRGVLAVEVWSEDDANAPCHAIENRRLSRRCRQHCILN